MLRKLLLLACAAAVMSGAALAQDQEVATGLNNPRNIALHGETGILFIAEAGQGGEDDVMGPFGPAKAGLTAQLSAVSGEGEFAVALPGLVSMDAGFGQVEGPTSVAITEDSVWLVLGLGPADMSLYPDSMVESLVQIDLMSGDIIQQIDLRAFETQNNPDEAEEIVSNPADVAVDTDGRVFIADASANSVITWTEADGLQLFAAWSGADGAAQAVPTAVAIGPDGDVYVGFLSGFPFLPESARIERYSADGELEFTYPGLTLVTDILVTDEGALYAVEMASGFGDAGYIPESGRIVSVTEDGVTPLYGGLNFPYGFALDADGSFLVTVDSAFSGPDSGRILRIAGENGA